MTAPAGPFARVIPHVVREGFLGQAERADLLAFTLAHEAAFAPAMVVGRTLDPAFRTARVLDRAVFAPWHRRIEPRVGAVLPGLLADLGMPAFAPAGLEIELAAHNHDDFYRRHIDTLGHDDAARGHRVLSLVYYFHAEPKAFDGGALRLFALADDTLFADVAPRQDRLVAFPAWGPHEVRPIACPSRRFADSRFAINIWARAAPRETVPQS